MNAVSTDVIPFVQLERMASALAKSGLFGAKQPEQALALMLIAQAEGVHPAQAMKEYHIIDGRPALKSEALLARYQRAGGRIEWLVRTDGRVVGKFSHPQGGTLEVEWTIERAKNAGLTVKKVWQSYPRQMLTARVLSEGVRATAPGVATGIYTEEEIRDMDPVDVTPAKAVEKRVEQAVAAVATALTEDERAEHAQAMKEAGGGVELAAAFAAAWKHAKEAGDNAARDEFKTIYDTRKAALEEM